MIWALTCGVRIFIAGCIAGAAADIGPGAGPVVSGVGISERIGVALRPADAHHATDEAGAGHTLISVVGAMETARAAGGRNRGVRNVEWRTNCTCRAPARMDARCNLSVSSGGVHIMFVREEWTRSGRAHQLSRVHLAGRWRHCSRSPVVVRQRWHSTVFTTVFTTVFPTDQQEVELPLYLRTNVIRC